MTCQSPTTPSGPVGYGLTFVHPTVARRFLASFEVTSPPDPLFALGHFEIGSMAGTIEPETLASCVTLEVQFEGQEDVKEGDFAVPVLQISAIAVRQDLPVNPLELQDHLVRAARHAAGHLGISMVKVAQRLRGARGWHVGADGVHVTTVDVPEIHLQPLDEHGPVRPWALAASA